MLDGEETTNSELDEDEWGGEVGLNTMLMEGLRMDWDAQVEAAETVELGARKCKKRFNKDTKFR